MRISNISAQHYQRTNFSSNLPIYKVIKRFKDGTQVELNSRNLLGPVAALIKRLNQKGTAESNFMLKCSGDYNKNPIATSSIIGKDKIVKKHIILGADAQAVGDLRRKCFRDQRITREVLDDTIKKEYIEPTKKKLAARKYLDSSQYEPVGLILYTDEVKGGYNKLNGLKIVTNEGRVIRELPPLQPKTQAKPKITTV